MILFSIISKGYIFYALEFRLHRVLVALPVLLFLFSKLVNRITLLNLPITITSRYPQRLKKAGSKLFIIFVFFITISGLYYNQNFLNNRSPNPHYSYMKWINANVNTHETSILYITHEAGRFNNLISLSDTLRYFIPNIKAIYISTLEIFKEDCYPRSGISGMILIPEIHKCYYPLITQTAVSQDVSNLGGFKSSPEMNLVLFAVK